MGQPKCNDREEREAQVDTHDGISRVPSLIDFHYSGASTMRAVCALHRVYPRYSLKRRVAYLVNAANLLLLGRRPALLGRLQDALTAVPGIGADGACAVLLHKIGQNGRAYAYAFDHAGELKTVTKIALGNATRAGVEREHAILRQLAGRELPFQVPQLISFHASPRWCALTVSAVDASLRIHDKLLGVPGLLFDAIATIRPTSEPVELRRCAFEWFDATLPRVTNMAIGAVARRISPDETFSVCAAHCDLGSENVFSSSGAAKTQRYAIIDWEMYVPTAPALTDRVAFWLGQHHRSFKRSIGRWGSNAAAVSFLLAFEGAPGGVSAAVLALLGLADKGNDLALCLCGATQ